MSVINCMAILIAKDSRSTLNSVSAESDYVVGLCPVTLSVFVRQGAEREQDRGVSQEGAEGFVSSYCLMCGALPG